MIPRQGWWTCFCAGLVLACLLALPRPANASFTSVWTSTETDSSYVAALGDSDGDGDADYLACNNGINRLYRNDGGNTFTLVWSSTEADYSVGCAWGDYDGDGDLDQLVSNYGQANRVYRNNGGNTFTLVWSSTETENSYGAAWADVDADGDLDQVVVNSGQVNRVYRYDGGDVFTAAWASTETDASYGLAMGDYDNDGDLDMLVGNDSQANRVYRNDSVGGVIAFTLVWSSTETDRSAAVAWADFDGDGDLDQLIGNVASPCDLAGAANRIYRNDGGNAFTLVWTSTETDCTSGVAAGDVDGDGNLDHVSGNDYGANRYYGNLGGNAFSLSWSSGINERSYGISLGDMDLDGDLDLVTSNSPSLANRVWRNDLNPTNAAPPTPTITTEPDGLSGSVKLQWASGGADDHTPAALITYNLRVGTTPGGKEIMSSVIPAGPGNVGQSLSWSLNLSAGASSVTYYWSVQAIDNTGFLSSSFAAEDSFVISGSFTSVWSTANEGYAIDAGDLDNDGDLDLVLAAYAAHTTKIFRNDGGNSYSLTWTGPTSHWSGAKAPLGDYDRDGDLDLAFSNYGGHFTEVFRNDSISSFTSVFNNAEPNATNGITWGDTDNDGDLDLFVGICAGCSPGFYAKLYRNDNGAFTSVWTSPEVGTFHGVALGDYDLDGDLDLFVANHSATANRVYRNDGNNTFTLVWTSTETDNSFGVELGDYDGDGDVDMLVPNNGASRIYQNNRDGTFPLVWSSSETNDAQSAGWGDFDGDGDLDFFLLNFSAPRRIYRNEGGGSFSVAWASSDGEGNQFGGRWGDFDGDGDLDLLGSSTTTSRIYRNNLNPTNSAPATPSLTAEPDGVSGSIKLEWAAASDAQTPAALLTYNLRVGTTPGGNEVMSAKIPAGPGNVGQSLSWSLNLSAGASSVTYYWSVQAIDNTGFLSSSFAAEDSFVIIQTAFASVWSSADTDATYSVVWGDYDGDGDQDLAAANYGLSKRVYRNDGAGAFTSIWTSVDTDNTKSIAWGDYDGDGDLDLAAGNASQAKRVYRNDGGGSFTSIWTSADTDATESIAWGDADGDGDLDLAAANYNQANRVYRNDGGGIFTSMWTSADTDATRSLVWGDYDNDGDLDLAAGNFNQAKRIYRNDGGTFTSVWTSGETESTYEVSWADTDGDGDLDLLAANNGQAKRLYRNDNGSFTSVWTSADADTTWKASWGDYDGDGDLDMVTANNGQAKQVYRNDGGNTFSSSWSSPDTDNSRSVAWADQDADGDLDMAAGNFNQTKTLYRNDLNPTNAAPTTPSLTSEPDGLSGSVKLEWASGGADDHTPAALITYNLRVGTTPGGNEVMSAKIPAGPGNVGQSLSWSLNLSGSTGSRTYYWSVQAIDNTGFLSSAFATEDSFVVKDVFSQDWVSGHSEGSFTPQFGDLDGDGDADMAVPTAFGTPIRVYLNNGSGAYSDGWTSSETDSSRGLALGDVDNDGDLDIAVANDNTTADRVYKNNGAGTFSLFWSSTETHDNTAVAFGDYDNDGDLDLASSRNANMPDSVYKNDGTGSYTLVASLGTNDSRDLKWADFNGDGVVELVVAHYNQAKKIYAYSGNDSFTPIWTSVETTSSTGVDVGDYDNDGDLDLIFSGHSTLAAEVYRNNGSMSFTRVFFTSESANAWATKWGDYDADGALDFLVANNAASSPPNYVYHNDGSNTFSKYTDITTPDTSGAAWADVDGDGDMDMGASSQTAPVKAFLNNLNPANSPPSSPGLTSEPDGLSGSVLLQWSASTDDHTPASGLTYNLRVGITPGGNGVFSSKIPAGAGNVGQSLSWSLNLSGSTGSRTYYWSIQAIDNTGFLSSSFAAEDSFVISDGTPPSAVGSLTDSGSYTTSTTSIGATWTAATDADSGVADYVVSVGTTPGASNAVASQSVGLVSGAAIAGSFVNGTTYYVNVAAVNGAGLTGSVLSTDGITIDATAPSAVGALTDSGSFQLSTTTVSASWAAASDAESGVVDYVVSVGTSPGASNAVASQSVGLVTGVGIAGSFSSAVTYYINVTAVNAAGLTGSLASTDGIVVDVTLPSAVSVLTDSGSYQFSTTTVSATWSAATDAQSGISDHVVSVGTTPGASDAVASQSVGLVTGAAIAGSFVTGTTYYVSVAAVNGVGLTGSADTTNGILVDATAPSTVGSLTDSGAYQTSTTTVSASWTAASDAESGVVDYVVSVGTTPGASDAVASQSVGLVSGAAIAGSYTNGATYYVNVAAVNGAGLTGSVLSTDGIMVENTAPSAVGTLTDSGSFQLSTTTVSASWTAATDAESGISDYVVSVGTTPGATDAVASQSVGLVTGVGVAGSFSSAVTYYINVATVNAAGLVGSLASTDGILVDVTAPSAVGALTDSGSYQLSTTTVSATWSAASDAQSSIADYVVSVGTTPGASNTVASQSVGLVSGSAIAGSFVTGTTYYVSVAAVNGAGLTGSVASTDGIVVDATGPSAVGSLTDSGSYTTSTTSIGATWTAATDAESAVASYEVSVGTIAGATNTVASQSVGLATGASLAGSYTNGVTYYVNVAAINGAGARGPLSSTDGVTVDTNTPTAVTGLNDGAGADETYASSASTLMANWSAASGGASGIAGYSYSIGTTPGGSDVVLTTSVGLATSATATGLSLTDGVTYYVSVRAVNGLGVSGPVASTNGVTRDASAPTAPATVNDGAGADQSYVGSLNSPAINWSAASDAHSGVTSYTVALGTTPGASNVAASSSVGVVTSHTFTGLSLTGGQTYYASVRAQNGAGLWGAATSSNGVVADGTAPGSVSGLADEGAYTTSTTTLSFSFSAATDAESPVTEYSYSIGTTAGGADVRAFASLGLTTALNATGLTLVSGQTYYVTVRALNAAGLVGAAASTDGILLDTSAPAIGQVSDGSGADVDVWGTATTVSANWTGVSDPESGVVQLSVSLGLSAGVADVAPWQNVTGQSAVTFTGLSLAAGQRFYVNLRAQNGAGLVSVASSNGAVVVLDAPTAVGALAGPAAILSQNHTLAATWTPATSSLGVAGYSVSVGTSPGASDTVAWQSVGLNTSVTLTGLNLSDGVTYYLNVRAQDTLGQAGAMASTAGTRIDLTPPALGLTSPAAGAAFSASSVVFSGTIEAGATLLANHPGTVQMTGGAFTATLTLPEGSPVVQFTATDAALNQSVQTLTVNVDVTAPVLTLNVGEATARPLTITVGASDNQVLAQATLGVQVVGDGATWQQIGSPLTPVGAALSATAVSWDPGQRVGAFEVVLRATDGVGNAASLVQPLTLVVTPTLTKTWAKNRWHQLSVPGRAVPSEMRDHLTGKNINAMRYDPTLPDGGTPVTRYSGEFTMGEGKAFWLYPYAQDGVLTMTYQRGATNGLQPVRMLTGWNQIGVPFELSVNVAGLRYRDPATGESLDFDAAKARGWIKSYLWGYQNDQYVANQPGSTLTPWEGYFQKVTRDLDLVFDPALAVRTALPRLVRDPPALFNLKARVAKTAGEGAALQSTVDLSVLGAGATDRVLGRLSSEAPPPPPKYVRLLAQEPTTGGETPTPLARSAQAAAAQGETVWTLLVDSNEAGQATLSFEGFAPLSGDWRVRVKDLATGQELGGGDYTFALTGVAGQFRQFEVRVKEASGQGLRLEESTLQASPGWSAVAFGVEAVPSRASDQLPGVALYQYHQGRLLRPDGAVAQGRADIQAGLGYLLHLEKPTALTVKGAPPTLPVRVPLEEGWNLLGNPGQTALKTSEITLVHNGETLTLSQSRQRGFTDGVMYLLQNGDYQPAGEVAAGAGFFLFFRGPVGTSEILLGAPSPE